MEDIIKQLSREKEDLVFVGSVVYNQTPNDLDVVVTSTDHLETFGETIVHQSKSLHSKSGKRSQIVYNGVKIDIFIEDELPPHNIIDGVKFATIEHMVNHYTELLTKTSGKMRSIIQSKIEEIK